MNVFRHPLHLLAVVGGVSSVAVLLWGLVPPSLEFVSRIGGLVALVAAVDLARRLGLEPSNDPAAPHSRKVR